MNVTYTTIPQIMEEARQAADKLNNLNSFMASDIFPTLERVEKDLLYEEQRILSKYVQNLGKRIELGGETFSH